MYLLFWIIAAFYMEIMVVGWYLLRVTRLQMSRNFMNIAFDIYLLIIYGN